MPLISGEPNPAATVPLALTIGDPAGIGLDITLQAWRQRNAFNLPKFCLIGDARLVNERAVDLGLPAASAQSVASIADVEAVFKDALPVLEIDGQTLAVEPGKPNPNAAGLIIGSIRTAVELTLKGEFSAIVTNPIAKDVLMSAGFNHAGHTEYLGELSGNHLGTQVRPVMLMASDKLFAVPLTVHVPLHEVADGVTAENIIETVKIMTRDLKRFFAKTDAKIAVCGLNPHAGESGKLGREEIDIIQPAVRALQDQGFNVSGPFSADTLFHDAARKTYDAALAMYHDQALIPFKMLSFADGVNVTLGLPFIRTSPDHGTAFSLAGTGKASCESLAAALRLAHRMAQQAAIPANT